MPYVPENFVDLVGPVVSADWLNGVDKTVYFVLNGAETVAEAQIALGIATFDNPLAVSAGGTGNTTGVGLVINGGPETGVVNAYVVAVPPGSMGLVNALVTGQLLTFQALNKNTGASTINVGGTGIVAILGETGLALTGGEIAANAINVLRYNGAAWQVINESQIFQRTTLETSTGIFPINYTYPAGNPRRYGAVGDGVTDDTAALVAAIISNVKYIGQPGDVYGVQTITFSGAQLRTVDFNGSTIKGIATTAQSCAVRIATNFCTFYNYQVTLSGNGGSVPTPNPNYGCGTNWQGLGGGTGGSQFNTFFGMRHFNCVRGVIYGVPTPGASALILSENAVFGFSSLGVSNPLLINNSAGFLHVSNPTFFCDVGGWTVPVVPATARLVEIPSGNLYVQGGEMEFAESSLNVGGIQTGYAADLANCTLVGMNWECAPPVRIIGDNAKINGGQFLNNQQNTAAFSIDNGVTGSLNISDMNFIRAPNATGNSSETPLVDATLADPSFTTILSNTSSEGWMHALVAHNARLIKGGKASYKNHRFQQVTGTPTYTINTEPRLSLLSDAQVDHLGYDATTWKLVTSAGGSTLLNTTAAGPTGYLASQLTLHATGLAAAFAGDPTSLATLKTSALRVRPGELYWGSVQANMTTGASANTIASFYDLTGAPVSRVAFADATGIGNAGWNLVEAGFQVPANAAYMLMGVQITVSGDLQFTDIRVNRA